MATTLLQVRVDESLKDDAARVFDELGIDTSTAIRMFLKRSVAVNGIPFSMTLPERTYKAEAGLEALRGLSELSAAQGLSNMSLDEINAEIELARKETGKA